MEEGRAGVGTVKPFWVLVCGCVTWAGFVPWSCSHSGSGSGVLSQKRTCLSARNISAW